MHLKWPSYLLLLEKQCIFNPKTGHESPDSDPRLLFQFTSLFSASQRILRKSRQSVHNFIIPSQTIRP